MAKGEKLFQHIKGAIQGPMERGMEGLYPAWANPRRLWADVEWIRPVVHANGGYAVPKEWAPKEIREMNALGYGYSAYPEYGGKSRRTHVSDSWINNKIVDDAEAAGYPSPISKIDDGIDDGIDLDAVYSNDLEEMTGRQWIDRLGYDEFRNCWEEGDFWRP